MGKWKTLFCCGMLLASSPVFSQEVFAKLGAGIGVPYGIIGAGAELGIPYVSIVGGIGTAVYGPGWSVGGRLYALPSSATWRPHLTVVYGTTTYYKITGDVQGSGTLRGFGYYIGVDEDIARPGGAIMTYGIGYLTHESLPGGLTETDKGIPIKIMLAWNYRFDLVSNHRKDPEM